MALVVEAARRRVEAAARIAIRTATLDDTALIAELGARTFRDTFGADNTEADYRSEIACAPWADAAGTEQDGGSRMAEYMKDEALAFIEAMRLTVAGRVGFKWMVERLSDLSAYVVSLADENERLKARLGECDAGREATAAERGDR